MKKNKRLFKKRFLSFLLILSMTLLISLKVYIENSIVNKNKVLATGTNSSTKDKSTLMEKGEELIEKEETLKEDDIENNIEKVEDSNQYVGKDTDEKDSTSQEIKNNENINNDYVDDVSLVIPETLYKWNFYREDNRKIAYLTFDDGPSEKSTEEILDILLKNNIKGTFFTLGTAIENNERADVILKRMLEEGHSIGNHGYSHDYRILYPNRNVDVQAFIKDIEKNDKILKSILGNDFSNRLIRMPGGYSSWNGTGDLDKVLEEKGLYQMDWNALNGDADGREYSKEELLNNLKDTVQDKDVIIVLMHDTDRKTGTVEYLQSAIDYLKENGFEFRTLK